MKIVTTSKFKLLLKNFSGELKKTSPLFFAFFIFIFAFILGNAFHKYGLTNALHKYVNSLSLDFKQTIGIYKSSFHTNKKLERVLIDLKSEDYQKLIEHRAQGIVDRSLIKDQDDYVNGELTYKGKKANIKIRLKGDNPDHFEGIKWSYRIKIEDKNKSFDGMKRFSIQHPRTRSYLYEWFFMKAAQEEDIMTIRYEFIDLVLNGKHLGIYAVEEHFDQAMVEHNRRKVGPILRYDEDLVWQHYVHIGDKAHGRPEMIWYSTFISAHDLPEILLDKSMRSEFVMAANLLERVRRDEIPFSAAFDTERMAKFFALSDIFDAEHGQYFTNQKFYYNGVTSKFEIIPYDLDPMAYPTTELVAEIYNYPVISGIYEAKQAKFWGDLNLYRAYIKNLEKFSQYQYVEKLFEKYADQINFYQNAINSEMSLEPADTVILSIDRIKKRQDFVRQKLHPVKAFHAYFKGLDKQILTLDLANIQGLAVEIKYIDYLGTKIDPVKEIILMPKKIDQAPSIHQHQFKWPMGLAFDKDTLPELKIKFSILGAEEIQEDKIFEWTPNLAHFNQIDLLRLAPNYSQFPFIKADFENKILRVLPGKWEINKNLIIPANFTKLVFSGKSQIIFSNNAQLISYCPLSILGTEVSPISFSAKEDSTSGILILNTKGKSIIDHAYFEKLSAPTTGSDAAITFYESEVDIKNSIFQNNLKAQNFLEIIRTNFNISKTTFKNVIDQAIDVHFSNGDINDSFFENISKSAIVFSNSNVELKNIKIGNNSISDLGKKLGVDENSHLTIDGKDFLEIFPKSESVKL